MRTTSSLIIGAAALLQFSDFASAEICESYEDSNGDNTLCGPTGALASYPAACAADSAGDTFSCTFDDCCEPEDCTTAYDTTVDCATAGALDTLPASCNGAACTFEECCKPETCANDYDCTSTGGTAWGTPGTCVGQCTDADCCIQTCRNGKDDHSGLPFDCTVSDEALDPTALDTDCPAGGCDDGTCCTTSTAYCVDYTCSVEGEGVPTASETVLCDNECDDSECGCTAVAVTCREELHSCSSGSRIDTNTCPDGIDTCTDALCCEPETTTTITESRMMHTPRSRMGQMQYGA